MMIMIDIRLLATKIGNQLSWFVGVRQGNE